MPGQEPSHGDILVQIGELKGQVNTLITLVGQKREDLNAMFTRVGQLEKTSSSREDMIRAEARISNVETQLAKWAGICLAAAFLMPIVMPRIQQGLGIIERDIHPPQRYQQGSEGG